MLVGCKVIVFGDVNRLGLVRQNQFPDALLGRVERHDRNEEQGTLGLRLVGHRQLGPHRISPSTLLVFNLVLLSIHTNW